MSVPTSHTDPREAAGQLTRIHSQPGIPDFYDTSCECRACWSMQRAIFLVEIHKGVKSALIVIAFCLQYLHSEDKKARNTLIALNFRTFTFLIFFHRFYNSGLISIIVEMSPNLKMYDNRPFRLTITVLDKIYLAFLNLST